MKQDLDFLKYPIGKYQFPNDITAETIQNWLMTLEQFPAKLMLLTKPLTDQQLDTPYRPGGWTIRQLLVHIGDSHLNSYVRYKWALTEDNPRIKAYGQDGWATLGDISQTSGQEAVDFISIVHTRWIKLLRSLSTEEWHRTFIHPETDREVRLDQNLGLYDWHARHHYAHIANAIK